MNKTALNQDFYAEKYKSAMSLLKLAVQSCRIDLIAYILTYINLQEEELSLIFAIFCKRVCLEKYTSWRGTELAAKFTGLQKTVPLKGISLSETEKKFLERIRSNSKLPLLQQTITDALRKDSVSAFEIALLICNQRISLHHIYTALTSNARNIVMLLMQKYSGRIFKLRSPQEWLFIICNNFCNSAAITAIRCIEEIFPGIVKSSKDPWGCNLLWHTLYNDFWLQEEYCRLEKLQNELIKLDCDPDEKNSIGLSFNLIKEYDKC